MAEQTNEMSFWGHLDVLRGILFKIAAVVIVFRHRGIYNHALVFRSCDFGSVFGNIYHISVLRHDLGCRASPCRTISKL